jgi:hypothetical protein
MAITRLLADNVFVRLLRGDTARDDLVVSMTGVKIGDRLIVMGLSEPRLLAALGSKVGLTGRACGVDSDETTAAAAGHHAEKSGVLVEVAAAPWNRLPHEAGEFDVTFIRAAGSLQDEVSLKQAVDAGRRLLRDGGRCVVLVTGAARGLRRLRAPAAGPPAGRVVELLREAGYRGARVLAERTGLAFAEAVSRH